MLDFARPLFQVVRGIRGAIVGSAIALLSLVACQRHARTEPFFPNQGDPADIKTDPRFRLKTDPRFRFDTELRFRLVTVLTNLEYPWGMVWLPDGSMLITERPGRVRIVREGVLDPTPIPGLPAILAESSGGLLDIALHPRFTGNRLVYFAYAHGTRSANRTRIARATFDGEQLRDWQVIFEVAQTKPRGQHFGARLLWLPDGTLL
ncbi:MAG: PQQ-dependent sugar dehydrogenase, partial [Cyanobacteria bacterium J06639_1]